MDFIFLSSCMLLTFFLILFLSFPETNFGSAEKALSKTKVDSSQPMHMKL